MPRSVCCAKSDRFSSAFSWMAFWGKMVRHSQGGLSNMTVRPEYWELPLLGDVCGLSESITFFSFLAELLFLKLVGLTSSWLQVWLWVHWINQCIPLAGPLTHSGNPKGAKEPHGMLENRFSFLYCTWIVGESMAAATAATIPLILASPPQTLVRASLRT